MSGRIWTSYADVHPNKTVADPIAVWVRKEGVHEKKPLPGYWSPLDADEDANLYHWTWSAVEHKDG